MNHMIRGTVHILTYITEKIRLPHSNYRSHGQYDTWICRPNLLQTYAKTQPTTSST